MSPELRDEDVSAAFRDALYAHTCRYIATAGYGDLHAFLDVIAAAYAQRVGDFAPLVSVAVEGIHRPLIRQERREQGMPR